MDMAMESDLRSQRELIETKDNEIKELKNQLERKEEQMRVELAKKDNEFDFSREQIRNECKKSERWFTSAMFLLFFVVACVSIIIERHNQLNDCLERRMLCNERILRDRLEALGTEHRKELRSYHEKAERLYEMRGKYEEQSTSVSVVQHTKDLLEKMLHREDERVDECHQNLRKLERNLHQILINMTILAQEKVMYADKYKKCVSRLEEDTR